MKWRDRRGVPLQIALVATSYYAGRSIQSIVGLKGFIAVFWLGTGVSLWGIRGNGGNLLESLNAAHEVSNSYVVPHNVVQIILDLAAKIAVEELLIITHFFAILKANLD
jgi:hypothetical protein